MVIWVHHSRKKTTIKLLQKEVYKITKWAHSKRLTFEIKKTKAILFHPSSEVRKKWSDKKIHLNEGKDSPLPHYDHAKLLGITFSANCTFQQHMGEVIKKANARVSHLYRITGKIPPNVLHRVYKVAIEPIVLYRSEVLYENYTVIE